MTLVRAAKPGLFIDMSQTKQQEQGAAAEPEARKHWEWFWRVVAGLMLVVIAWVVWVLYQITPRSVVTPLAYASQVRPIGATQPSAAATAPAPAQEAAAPPVAQPGTAGAAAGADTAAAATQSGVRAVSADAQSGSAEKKEESVKAQGLRLATELSAPPVDKPGNPKAGDGKPGGAAALPAAGAARKDRP